MYAYDEGRIIASSEFSLEVFQLMPAKIDTASLEQLESEFVAAMRAYFQKLIRDHAVNDNIVGKDALENKTNS